MRLSVRSSMSAEYKSKVHNETLYEYEKQRQVFKSIIMWASARALWFEEGDIKNCVENMTNSGKRTYHHFDHYCYHN